MCIDPSNIIISVSKMMTVLRGSTSVNSYGRFLVEAISFFVDRYILPVAGGGGGTEKFYETSRYRSTPKIDTFSSTLLRKPKYPKNV